MRFKFLNFAAVALGASLALLGCANERQSCGNKVLIPWPSAAGGYSLQEVQLRTLSNPYVLDGPAAKVFFESRIGAHGFEGPAARPHLTGGDGVCLPQDTDSAAALSAYVQMERLMGFEKRLGTYSMLNWPRQVGVQIQIRSDNGSAVNNAHYDPTGDVIAILPYTMNGVPSNMNLGIVAHEHFHAHFQRQVVNPLNAALTSGTQIPFALGPVDDLEKADITTAVGLNAYVMRAWNEGLADVYAAIYTGNPRFLGESMANVGKFRALDAPVRPLWTSRDLQDEASRVRWSRDLIVISYQEGASLARIMYQLAQVGDEPPEIFLSKMLHRLHSIPGAVQADYNAHILEFSRVIPLLLADEELTEASCEILRKAALMESFSQCAR